MCARSNGEQRARSDENTHTHVHTTTNPFRLKDNENKIKDLSQERAQLKVDKVNLDKELKQTRRMAEALGKDLEKLQGTLFSRFLHLLFWDLLFHLSCLIFLFFFFCSFSFSFTAHQGVS